MSNQIGTSPALVARFAKLFRGNTRSYGIFDPDTGKMRTEHKAAETEEYIEHLGGTMGLGLVPILDDATCWFGAIDIDAHGDIPDVSLKQLEERVREKDLPLIVCRSKSGGAHLYAFGSEPLPAKLLRSAMAKWATALGHGGCEVFPKQEHLPMDSEGERQLGNWINLCWFDADNPKCLRYAVEGGKRVNMEYFLELAESRKVSSSMLVERSSDEHDEAPPCIQSMIANGVGRGQRNEALYNMVIYLKKAYPETWKDKAFDLNSKVFEVPLEHSEAKKTITSAGRREYRYRCKEEPCRALCKSSICVRRKFGITPEEKSELELGKDPNFQKLEKMKTDPPRWILYIDGSVVSLTTPEVMDYRRVREAVAEILTKLVPPMKNDRWQAMLHKLMEDCTEIEAPEEASTTGFIGARLSEFFHRTDMTSDGTDKGERETLLLGSPVVQINENTGLRCIYFRGSDFIDYLKKNRSEDLKGPNLWMALRKIGVGHTRLRIGRQIISVWYAPMTNDDDVELPDPSFEPEL
jgi:hypothetical protein